MECNFCKSGLKSMSSLNHHKKNNKKCLEIQRNISNAENLSLTLCSFCKKRFTNIKTHVLTCKIKKNDEGDNLKLDNNKLHIENEKLWKKNERLQKINKKLQKNNQLLEDENNKQNVEIIMLKEHLVKIEAENNIYKKDHETITSMAKQPKTTYNLSVYDDNLIKDRFILAINNVKPSDLYGG